MWTNPWGNTPKEKNRFQAYFVEIVKASENEDWMYIKQLKDELTLEQELDLWFRLASDTRRKIKNGFIALNAEAGSSQ